MKRCRKMLVCVAGGLTLAVSARAVSVGSPGNPYEGIAERNLFGLKPPPPPPAPPEPPPVKAPQILLQGTTSIFGYKQVMFKAQGQLKPGEPPKEQFYTLREGQREDDIEVLEIDEKGETVKFNNHGVVQPLSFKENSVKVTAAPGPIPGAPMSINPGMGQPVAMPGAAVPGAPTPFSAAVPAPPGFPTFPPAPNATPIGAPAQRTIPTRTLRAGPAVPGAMPGALNQQPAVQQQYQQPYQQPAQEPSKAMTAEEQAAVLQVLGQLNNDLPPPPPVQIRGGY